MPSFSKEIDISTMGATTELEFSSAGVSTDLLNINASFENVNGDMLFSFSQSNFDSEGFSAILDAGNNSTDITETESFGARFNTFYLRFGKVLITKGTATSGTIKINAYTI